MLNPNKTFLKRGRLDIIYEILTLSRKPVRKTRILYKCNLSYELLQKYNEYLISNGLLMFFEEDGNLYFQLTETGKKFRKGYEQLKKIELNLQSVSEKKDFAPFIS
jgi:predicted transcriptional regulator